MEQILTYLKQLDLSELEAKLYLKLLETGPISVRELAKTIGVKRTTVYIYIDQLADKGLLIKIVKGSHKQVAANTPEECLQDLVEEKVQTAKHVQTELADILHTITTSLPRMKDASEAEIKYYKGKQGVKKIYEEALQAKELRTYVKVETTDGLFSDNVDLFNNAFRNNPTLTVKEMIYDSPFATKDAQQILSKNKRYGYKLMPKELKLASGDILMYDDKVVIITYIGQLSCIVLKNIDYYNNSKELFDYIWRTLA